MLRVKLRGRVTIKGDDGDFASLSTIKDDTRGPVGDKSTYDVNFPRGPPCNHDTRGLGLFGCLPGCFKERSVPKFFHLLLSQSLGGVLPTLVNNLGFLD